MLGERENNAAGISLGENRKVTHSMMLPIPDQVRENLLSLLPGIRKKKLKGMVCPAGGFTASLFSEGLLSDEEIMGLLDNDETKYGSLVAGLPVKPISSIEINRPNFIIVASLSFNKEILAQLLPFSRRYRFKLLDICSVSDRTIQIPFVNSCFAPLPAMVLENLNKQIPSLISSRSRVLLYPYHPLVLNLWLRGIFANLDARGIVDSDKQLAGTDCHGLRVYSLDQLDSLDADVILVANPGHHSQIATELATYAPTRSLKIIDLSEGMTIEGFRSELAESLGRQIWVNRMAEWPAHKVQIWTPSQSLCDSLCAISAAREFARRHPDLEVRFQRMPEILDAYGDDLVRPGSGGYVIPDHSQQFLSERWSPIAGNYQGCFYLGLGLDFDVRPRPELPMIPPIKGLTPQSFIVLLSGVEGLQPTLSLEQLDSIARIATLPVVSIGDARTRSRIKGADYVNSSPLEMLRLIQHAAVVLTSRSVPAHISAAYNVPSIVWVFGDGFDWHIDYPAWNHRQIEPTCHGFIDQIGETMESLLYATRVPMDARISGSNSECLQSHGQ